MPRFRNTVTGSVVNVDDDTVAHLGSEYEAADKPEKAPTKKPASSKSEK